MNILTKNRILEAGDEYRNNGAWKPIRPKDIGLQIRFTEYLEVRRPSEEPAETHEAKVTERNEPSRIPPAEFVDPAIPASVDTDELKSLPTVISKKAHRVHTTGVPLAILPLDTRIDWDTNKVNKTRWTGRNGTFNNIGLSVHRIITSGGEGIIRFVPVGKRGEAKNALIEMPVEAIPALVEWLLPQYVGTKIAKAETK